MNYYIQGDAAKAEQIKAALKAKGISDGGNSFIHNNYLYFTEGGEADFCHINGHVANIIKAHPYYKELELPVEPKFKVRDWVVDGDTVAIIYDLQKMGYVGHDINRKDFVCKYSDEGKLRLWTIQDAKDGDVLATDNGWTCIFQAFDGYLFSSYCFMDSQKWFCESGSEVHTLGSSINGKIHPATKEQSDLLFAKMREAGYEWDADKKELKKIKTHYNIANFHAGMPVLVRILDKHKWCYLLFSHCYKYQGILHFQAGGAGWLQCIPYKGNEHLLGTTDMPSEEYINW